MEFRQISTFVQVANHQSFSKAAEYMGYTQSAVTVHIRNLESELNTQLFDRIGKRVVLTAQGEQFLTCARRILYEVDQAKYVTGNNREPDGLLRVGTIESLCFSKLPPILSYFRSHYPKVSIQIITDSPEELIRQMERNELDLIYILDVPRWMRTG